MNIKVLAIENTTRCGADCIMCRRHSFRHKIEDMPFDLFRRSVDEGIKCGVSFFNLCGFGDPPMDSDFIKKLAYIKDNYPQTEIGMTSTCHIVSGEILDAVCQYMDVLQISMYGLENSYEKVHRGALKFTAVKENIDRLLDRKDRPYTVLRYLLMPENKCDYDAWLKYYEGRADRVDVWKIHSWGGELSTGGGIDKKPFIPCQRIATLNGLYVRCDGEVSMCCIDYNRELSCGNIATSSLQDILQGETVKLMQQMNKDGTIREYKICRTCDQLHDRSEALVYSSSPDMSAGKHTMQPKEKIYN